MDTFVRVSTNCNKTIDMIKQETGITKKHIVEKAVADYLLKIRKEEK